MKINLYKSVNEIDFGRKIESFDHNFILDAPSNVELKNFLKDLRKDNETVAAMNVFCSTDNPCHRCTSPTWENYAPKLLNNLFERVFLTFNYNFLVLCGEKIFLKMKDEPEEFYRGIEQSTKLQSNSKLWKFVRCGRITASTFKKCCHTNINNPSKSLIMKIAYPENCSFENNATKWGKTNESLAINVIVREMKKTHFNLKCSQSGFIINANEPHIGASPDGVITCDCHGVYPLEIKCPYSLKHTTDLKTDLLGMKNAYVNLQNGNLELNTSHEYYYQVQMQMHVTNSQIGLFGVWCPSEFLYIFVKRDDIFLTQRLKLADEFFKKVLLPELIGQFYTQPRINLSQLRSTDFCKQGKEDFYNYSLCKIDDKILNKF